MPLYLVKRPFFDQGVRYHMHEVINITDTNYANGLIQWGVLAAAPLFREARVKESSEIIPNSNKR